MSSSIPPRMIKLLSDLWDMEYPTSLVVSEPKVLEKVKKLFTCFPKKKVPLHTLK